MNTTKKILLFVGQASNKLHTSSLVYKGWFEKFKMVTQKAFTKLSHQAESVVRKITYHDASYDDVSTEVVIGHSSGIIRALLVAVMMKSVKRVVLVCPAPVPGMGIPMHLYKYLLRPHYLLKVLFGEEFMLDLHTTRELMLNNLSANETAAGFEAMTTWSGKIVRQMLFDRLRYGVASLWRKNVWLEEVKKILHSRGVEIIVVVGTEDNMIPVRFASKIAEQLGAKAVQPLQAHHMLMVGKDSEYFFNRVLRLAEKGIDSK